jgi:hypothetical protein
MEGSAEIGFFVSVNAQKNKAPRRSGPFRQVITFVIETEASLVREGTLRGTRGVFPNGMNGSKRPMLAV